MQNSILILSRLFKRLRNSSDLSERDDRGKSPIFAIDLLAQNDAISCDLSVNIVVRALSTGKDDIQYHRELACLFVFWCENSEKVVCTTGLVNNLKVCSSTINDNKSLALLSSKRIKYTK